MHVRVSAHSKAPEYRLDERARPDAKSMIDFGRKDTHSDANTSPVTSYPDPHRNQSHAYVGRREKRANTTSSSGARRDSLALRADKLEEKERARDDEDPIYGGIKGLGRDRRIRGISVVVGDCLGCGGS